MTPRVIAGSLAMLLCLTACFGGSEKANVPPAPASTAAPVNGSSKPTVSVTGAGSVAPSASASPTPSPLPRKPDVTVADVKSVQVPRYCDFRDPKARLKDGELIAIGKDGVRNQMAHLVGEPLIIDLNGDGVKEALSWFSCNHGGVGWPDALIAIGPSGTLLDTLPLWEGLPDHEFTIGRRVEATSDGIRAHFVRRSEMHQLAPGTARIGFKEGKITHQVLDPLAGAIFSSEGLGPIRMSSAFSELEADGWVTEQTTCGGPGSNEWLMERGVDVGADGEKVTALYVFRKGFPTPSGIQVGDSRARVMQVYGNKATVLKTDSPMVSEDQVGVAVGGRSFVFMFYQNRVTGILLQSGPAKLTILDGC